LTIKVGKHPFQSQAQAGLGLDAKENPSTGVLPGLVRDYNTEVGPALQRMDAMNIRRIAFVLLGASVRPGGS
jgi:hypothetical protein